jgi:hypothetical protein
LGLGLGRSWREIRSRGKTRGESEENMILICLR